MKVFRKVILFQAIGVSFMSSSCTLAIFVPSKWHWVQLIQLLIQCRKLETILLHSFSILKSFFWCLSRCIHEIIHSWLKKWNSIQLQKLVIYSLNHWAVTLWMSLSMQLPYHAFIEMTNMGDESIPYTHTGNNSVTTWPPPGWFTLSTV